MENKGDRIFTFTTGYEMTPEVLVASIVRESIELCARVAEARSGANIAAAIRRLKPAASWP